MARATQSDDLIPDDDDYDVDTPDTDIFTDDENDAGVDTTGESQVDPIDLSNEPAQSLSEATRHRFALPNLNPLALLSKRPQPKTNKPKEELVRHQKQRRFEIKSPREIARATWRIFTFWLPVLAAIIGPIIIGPHPITAFYRTHTTYALILAIPLGMRLTYTYRNWRRTHPPRTKGGKPKRPEEPPLPPTRQWVRDSYDIVANLDQPYWRIAYYTLFAAAIAASGILFPVSITTYQQLVHQFPKHLNLIRPILISASIPAVAYIVPWMRCRTVTLQRTDEIETVFAIAKQSLGYPKTMPRNVSRTERRNAWRTSVPHLAIEVHKWSALYEIDTFFVHAPLTLGSDNVSAWDDFTTNLGARLPRPEEWRIQRDPRGRGAEVGPANYPTAVLWDGEYDPDPLTFVLGVNLETGDQQILTFSDVSPHMAISGATASGKLVDLSTIIKTPSGSRILSELRVGDEVFDESGRIVRITALSDIETPERAYRVRFNDNTSVVVDPRHLWTTWDRSARVAAGRQRALGPMRARKPWLSDEQRALLAKEIEKSREGDDISLPEVAQLLGILKDTPPLVETAHAIGVCRESTVTREFVYAEQNVVQEQVCLVFDREEVPTLVAALARSPREAVRAVAGSVQALAKNGSGPVSVPELTQVTGIDRARMRGLVKRSGVSTLRTQSMPVRLTVPGKVVHRTHPKTCFFYPKRPLLTALIERGALDLHDQRHKMSMPAVRTTQEIADTLRYQVADAGVDAASWANHSIPRCAPIQFPAATLPMDPYTLGAWLGDGSSNGGGFTGIDPDIWKNIEAAGYEMSHYPVEKSHYIKGVSKDLRAAGVLNNKHIPDMYLHASVEQRLALLQGLMDTDGSVNRVSGTCEFYQSNEAFARQVQSLVASLGMIAYVRSRPGRYRDAITGDVVECKEAWTVSFAPTMQVFRLPRKACLIDPEANRARAEHRYIVAVEEVDPVPMRCVMVDSDSHQFLVTDQYVATHNTSLAEVVAAQLLVKPMPWDPSLHGQVWVVDPKGPFARRWAGRPGVIVANGQEDSGIEVDENGDPVTGIIVMANAMQAIEEEHKRRQDVLKRYPDVATWIHLPDDVKREERFFPILVVLDEFIDHTDTEKANGDERIEKENDARDVVKRLAGWHARKYRNVGMHTALIGQELKMSGPTGIGSALLRQLAIRGVTGQMDSSQLQTMFGADREIPSLPSTRVVIENGVRKVKTIPGRARVMNAAGQEIHKVQVMYFGGKTNSETLDKWLPRGKVPPNGDFSLPAGSPRVASDFDADGNYIGGDPVADAAGGAPETLSSIETGPDDFAAYLAEEADAWDTDDAPGRGASPTMTAPDPDAVFPAANVEPVRCGMEGCVNDVDSSCSRCGEGFCSYHLQQVPDPRGTGLVCESCYAADPLVVSGVLDTYLFALDRVEGSDLRVKWVASEDNPGQVTVTVSTKSGQKVVQVVGDHGDLVARSRSGQVHGDAVIGRVDTVVRGHLSRFESVGEVG